MPKKLKIILYLPLILFFMANFFYFSLPAQAALNDSMPDWKMPDLQIDIGGLKNKFTIPTECGADSSGNTIYCVKWIGEYIAGVYKYAIGIVGILAAVVLMVGGVMWIIAGGSATMIGEAKAWIGASLTGLVIALCSYVILYQVNPALVRFRGLGIQMVDIKPEQLNYTGGGGEMGTDNIPNDLATRNKYDNLLRNAEYYDCTLLKAFMFAESSGNPNAVSPRNAKGLLQVMSTTAQSLGINGNLFDPQTNIYAGANYLTQLASTACNGSTANMTCATVDSKYIIAAYNGGPGANKESVTCPGKTYWECEANTGYAETRKFVNRVLTNYQNLIDSNGGC